MDKKTLIIAAICGTVIQLILTNIPFLNLVNVLLCAGFWVGAIIAVVIYSRSKGPVTIRQGVIIGAVTGVFSAIVGVILSFFKLAGITSLIRSISQIAPIDTAGEIASFQSGIGEILTNLCGGVVDIAFGIIGGILGALICRKK